MPSIRNICAFAATSAGLLGCATMAIANPPGEANPPPNVLLIVADDLGWSDLGCYGSTFYETPRLDGLATAGVRFTDAYASCPVCSPTRAALMTGKNPARIGLTAHVGSPQPQHYNGKTPLIPASYLDHLPLEEITVAEAFHDAGYATFFAGKWHLGSQDRHWPEYQGFDVNVGGWAQGGPFGGKQFFSPYGNPRLPPGPEGEHLPDRLATETIRFIESHRHEPFLAVLSFYSVHVPLVAREDLRQKYERKRNPFGEYDTPIWGTDLDGKTRVRLIQEHAVYAAMVEAMDMAIGKVLDKLSERGLSERTIVMFTSDNGGLSTGDRAISADQGWPTSNLPLRGGKGWLYEGGIRVPLIVKGPGAASSLVSDLPVCSADLHPTLLELTGVSQVHQQHVDGVSFASELRGEPVARGPLFWHYPHYPNQGATPGAAIRHGEWKLIEWYEGNRVELFHLAEDIGEKHNLADAEPLQRQQMFAQLEQWRTELNVRMPQPNANFVHAPASP